MGIFKLNTKVSLFSYPLEELHFSKLTSLHMKLF